MLVPITGSLELSAGSTTAATGKEVITAVPGQAYYMVKGQPHGFTNKTTAPVQVIEVFVKGEAPAPWRYRSWRLPRLRRGKERLRAQGSI